MANEKRLIDANDVYALFDVSGFARLHVGDIDTIPRVDAVEVVHGRWISRICSYGTPKCSVCDWSMPYSEDSYLDARNYCPNCGAKMDGDGNG